MNNDKRVYDNGPSRPEGYKEWAYNRNISTHKKTKAFQLGAHTCNTCGGNGGWLVGPNWVSCATCGGKGYTS
jgi:hypothetical protein